jgi:quinol monooxygenase YgiN
VILATTKVEDFDRFLETFSTRGAEKRKQHGSKGSTIFRDPNEDDRVWVVFEWEQEGYEAFLSDPEVQAIFQAAGLKERPQAVPVANRFDT